MVLSPCVWCMMPVMANHDDKYLSWLPLLCYRPHPISTSHTNLRRISYTTLFVCALTDGDDDCGGGQEVGDVVNE